MLIHCRQYIKYIQWIIHTKILKRERSGLNPVRHSKLNAFLLVISSKVGLWDPSTIYRSPSSCWTRVHSSGNTFMGLQLPKARASFLQLSDPAVLLNPCNTRSIKTAVMLAHKHRNRALMCSGTSADVEPGLKQIRTLAPMEFTYLLFVKSCITS